MIKVVSLDDLPSEGVSHDPGIAKKVMIRDGEIPHLKNFSQARFAPGQVAQSHVHTDKTEVFFVESGEGRIEVDGQNYPMKPGTCLAVKPSEVHEITNTGSTEFVLTYFAVSA